MNTADGWIGSIKFRRDDMLIKKYHISLTSGKSGLEVDVESMEPINYQCSLLEHIMDREGWTPDCLRIISLSENAPEVVRDYVNSYPLTISEEGVIGGDGKVLSNPKRWYTLLCTSATQRDGSIIQTNNVELKQKVDSLLVGKKPLPNMIMGYGSVLMTPCWHGIEELPIRMLITQDLSDTRQSEHGVGDCYAVMSPRLYEWYKERLEVEGEPAFQFRALIEGDGINAIGKGMVGMSESVRDSGYDLVIPDSSLKGGTWSYGVHEVYVTFGIHRISKVGKSRLSDQWLRVFSYSAKKEAYGERVSEEIKRLLKAGESVRNAIEYMFPRLDELMPDNDDVEDGFLPILQFMAQGEGELHDRLLNHPYIANRLRNALRKRWKHVALGAGVMCPRLTILPDDSLPFGVVSSVHFGEGELIPYKTPVQSHAEQPIWKFMHREKGHWGCVYMSHKTAAQITSDFDGDEWCFVERTPETEPLFREAERFVPISSPEKRKGANTQSMGELVAGVMNCTVGFFAQMMTAIYTQYTTDRNPKWLKWIEMVDRLLLASADIRKHAPYCDLNEAMRWCFKNIRKGRKPILRKWQREKNKPHIFITEPLTSKSKDDMGRWLNEIAAQWRPTSFSSLPLKEFQTMFGVATPEQKELGRKVRERYIKLLKEENEEAFGMEITEDEFKGLWWIAHDHETNRNGSPNDASIVFTIGWKWITGLRVHNLHLVSRITAFGENVLKVLPPQGMTSEVRLIRTPGSTDVQVFSIKKGQVIGVIRGLEPTNEPIRMTLIPNPLKDGSYSTKSCFGMVVEPLPLRQTTETIVI